MSLAEASPDSLQVLFERDPLSLTDENVEAIVTALRQQRAQWKQQEAKGKKVKPDKTTALGDLLDLSNLKLPGA